MVPGTKSKKKIIIVWKIKRVVKIIETELCARPVIHARFPFSVSYKLLNKSYVALVVLVSAEKGGGQCAVM